MDKKKHIILIGMPGSGKSSLGFHLSKLMGIPLIDTDNYIIAKEGRSISEIFDGQGEKAFRELEKQALAEIVKKEPSIISTGGGMPCFHDNMDIMNEFAVTVYLEITPEKLFKYLKTDRKRPLVKGKTSEELMLYIRISLENRRHYYEKADITVSALEGTPAQLAIELFNRISDFRKWIIL
jgi:shikimate kinase